MREKEVVLFLIISIIASFFYLSWQERLQKSPQKQDFWLLYFVKPKNESLDFVIENNSRFESFTWQAKSEDSQLEGSVEIEKGKKREIDLPEEKFSGNKVTIRVQAGENTKEIYKYAER